MIITNEFELSKKEYFELIVRIELKRRKWLIIFGYFMGILLLTNGTYDAFSIFLMSILFLYPFLIFFGYWRYANSKQNKIIYEKRRYEISLESIRGILSSGAQSEIPISSFIKTFELKDIFLLYIAKNQSFYFPRRIFKNNEDFEWFINEIFLKIKNK